MPSFVTLIYSNSDFLLSGPSMDTKGHGYGLDRADIDWFNRQWVPDESRWADPDISPLYSYVTGFPSTLAVTCEHDPLRDQGEAFAHRLTAAGVPVTLRREPGMVHIFCGTSSHPPAQPPPTASPSTSPTPSSGVSDAPLSSRREGIWFSAS